jgi:hypothetical protein
VTGRVEYTLIDQDAAGGGQIFDDCAVHLTALRRTTTKACVSVTQVPQASGLPTAAQANGNFQLAAPDSRVAGPRPAFAMRDWGFVRISSLGFGSWAVRVDQ